MSKSLSSFDCASERLTKNLILDRSCADGSYSQYQSNGRPKTSALCAQTDARAHARNLDRFLRCRATFRRHPKACYPSSAGSSGSKAHQ